jgi:hypothetical protein
MRRERPERYAKCKILDRQTFQVVQMNKYFWSGPSLGLCGLFDHTKHLNFKDLQIMLYTVGIPYVGFFLLF